MITFIDAIDKQQQKQKQLQPQLQPQPPLPGLLLLAKRLGLS